MLKVILFWTQLILLKILGKKIFWTAHNLKAHENTNPIIDHLCTRFTIKMSDLIIAHCETAQNEIFSLLSIKNKSKCIVIPHGNYISCYENTTKRIESRQQLRIHESSFVFLFIGKIRPYKGVIDLIEAFRNITDEYPQLIIAGKPLCEKYSKLISQKIGNEKRINFIPKYVPEEKIQVYMNASDVVVFPYKNILTSGAVILAMSFGKACIAPTLGCIPETLDESGSILYDPRTKNGLAKALLKAIKRKSELREMGKHNQQIAKQWNWDDIGAATANAYRACIE
ncbi:MAG: glycosyltransferase [Candidatus Heimdallarchaeota archaeon]|nr:glycosyltransferase [Candidatus Heimdallarchaeota archaeon]